MLIATFLAIGPLATPPASAAASTIMPNPSAADLVKHSDTSGVEVGTRFKALSSGSAAGMRFWKDGDTASTHEVTLWSGSGTKLAEATTASETSSGWQTAQFDRAVALKAGETYVVSYYAPRGQYAVTHQFDGESQSSALDIAAGSGVFAYGSTSRFPAASFRNSNYWVDVLFTPSTVTAPAPAPEPAPAPAPEPAPTPTPTPTPSTGFPTAATTGVPSGTSLSAYTGPCRITTANTVIDAKTVNCDLQIATTGVKITRSQINGTVYNSGNGSFSISDSRINMGAEMGTGIGDANFTATRVHITGGNRSVNCYIDCTIEDSYVHGQFRDASGQAHESGIRMGSGSVIRGNTIACDAPDVAPDAGCSAALTGYGDFAVVQNNTIDGNLFVAGSGGYCTYGGSTPGKPYSVGTRDIKFTNNVWERGSNGKCGSYGPITAFDSNAPGNQWSNNTWDDGTAVRPAN